MLSKATLGNNDVGQIIKYPGLLTQLSIPRPVELFQGLDQLTEKSTLNIGQSLRKENCETIHIIKFHFIGMLFEDDPTTAINLLRLACEGVYYIGVKQSNDNMEELMPSVSDIQVIKTDLENVTLYSICMVSPYFTLEGNILSHQPYLDLVEIR